MFVRTYVLSRQEHAYAADWQSQSTISTFVGSELAHATLPVGHVWLNTSIFGTWPIARNRSHARESDVTGPPLKIGCDCGPTSVAIHVSTAGSPILSSWSSITFATNAQTSRKWSRTRTRGRPSSSRLASAKCAASTAIYGRQRANLAHTDENRPSSGSRSENCRFHTWSMRRSCRINDGAPGAD